MLSLGAGMFAAPASAQQPSQVPACGDQVSTLVWQVRKDRKKRSVNLRYNKERGAGVPGAPLRPVQVQVERSAGTRSFEWTQLNREHYFFRRRGSEATRLTARYVENRSRYERLSTQEGNLGLPALPIVPTIITLPGLPDLPGIPVPIIPLLTGPLGGSGGQFQSDYCVRTLTRTVR